MKDQTKSYLKKTADICLQLLFPRRCPVCDTVLKIRLKDIGKPPFICPDCEKELQYPKQPRCVICSKPISDETEEKCDDCKKNFRFFDGGMSLLVHDDSARKIIYALKYKGAAEHADFLGYDMARKYGNLIRTWNAKALIPVPLHKKRFRERGYNQAELVARAILRFMDNEEGLVVDTDFLVRDHYTQPLKTMDGNKRANNIKKAFKVTQRGKYESVILIDDIYTTGATLNECARTLKKAGVKHVYFLTSSIVS